MKATAEWTGGRPTCRPPGAPITRSHTVGQVLARHPELLTTFVAFGFAPLINPLLRKTVARLVTVEGACRQQGVETAKLLDALNAARARLDGARPPLPVPSSEAPAPAEEPEEGPCCPHCAGRTH
jgi:hypothetical protein